MAEFELNHAAYRSAYERAARLRAEALRAIAGHIRAAVAKRLRPARRA